MFNVMLEAQSWDFHRDVTLIVIHRQHSIVLPLDGLPEDGIGRHGAGGGDALGVGIRDCRTYLLDLLAPDETGLPPWGLSAATPMRGWAQPCAAKKLRVSRRASSTPARVTKSTAVRIGWCVVR